MKKTLFTLFMLAGLAAFAQQSVPGNFRVGRDLYVVDDATVKGSLDFGQGWALYADSSTVYGSRQVIAEGDTAIVENNALGTNVTAQLPMNIDSLYNELNDSTGVIPAIRVNDLYLIRVDFTASSDAAGGAGKGLLYLDVNGTSVAQVPVLFVAADTATNLTYSYTIPAEVTSEWVSDGATVKFYSIAGNTKMYATRFRIVRAQVAK